jgi:hypothetical protein
MAAWLLTLLVLFGAAGTLDWFAGWKERIKYRFFPHIW